MDSREAERFEEGIEPEFLDAEEGSPKVPGNNPDSGHLSSASHGGYGSSSLQECLDILNQARSNSPAPCHSRVEIDEISNPQQLMSPNVEEEPIDDHEQVPDIIPEDQLLPTDEPQSRVKEERKDEEVTPKSARCSRST